MPFHGHQSVHWAILRELCGGSGCPGLAGPIRLARSGWPGQAGIEFVDEKT